MFCEYILDLVISEGDLHLFYNELSWFIAEIVYIQYKMSHGTCCSKNKPGPVLSVMCELFELQVCR